MNRKKFIKNSLSTVAITAMVGGCIPRKEDGPTSTDAPNIISRKKYRWKLVTTWPPKFPVLGEIADIFAALVQELSSGRIEIKVYGGGELVPPLEAFDAVSNGTADMGSGAAYYWAGKSPAMPFFSAVPFGMNAQQVTAWVLKGGGMELWRELYAQFNIVPFIGGNTGVQMGGWFNREINHIQDFKGLKMRMPGLGGKVIEKAGAAPVLIAGSEVYTSLERGVIDATEWVGPYHDYKMGLHKIAKYYYYPGWHEPGTALEFFINKRLYDNLPKDLQRIIETASMYAHNWVLSEFEAQNNFYLDKILTESDAQLKAFPLDVLQQLRKYTKTVIEAEVERDAFSKKVYESYLNYSKRAAAWSNITEKAYYDGVMEKLS